MGEGRDVWRPHARLGPSGPAALSHEDGGLQSPGAALPVCEVVFTLSVCLGCEPWVCSSVPLVPQGRAWALPTQEGCSEEGVQDWRGGRQGPGRLL